MHMTYPTDMANRETVKISMTLTEDSKEWLDDNYPEAQSTQEAIRMAVADARKHCEALRNANTHIDAD